MLTPDGSTTWGELLARFDMLCTEMAALRGARVGLVFSVSSSAFAAAAALEQLQCDVFLLSDDLSAEAAAELARDFRLGAIVRPASAGGGVAVEGFAGADTGSGQASVTILTSGTTGKPKAARHTWAGLARPARRTPDYPHPRWLLSYRPNLYAGLQVMMQCYVNAGTLIAPRAGDSAQDVVGLARRGAVQFGSATPSYWRWLITFAGTAEFRALGFAQITLGGETIDDAILQALRGLFPSARLVHIYATTELGRCFSVTDGRAGFPAKFLDGPSADGVELRIEEGELHVRSANSMRGYDPRSAPSTALNEQGYFATGDLVERVGDRVFFVGRRSDAINVGGNKVFPAQVERVIQEVAGVRDARVFGKRSSIAGELVAAEVVAEAGQDSVALVERVRAHCLERLTTAQRPRWIDVVDQIQLTHAGKKVRRSAN